MEFMLANSKELFAVQNVSGLVRFGIESKDDERRELASLSENLASDFIVIDDGKKTEWHSILLLPAGLVLLWWLIFGSKKKEQLPQPVQPPSLPRSSATPPPLSR